MLLISLLLPALAAPPVDLAAFPEVVGDADVLGVGEQIHLSGGLERARAELTWLAVQDLGFRLVAAELSWVEGRSVDRELEQCSLGIAEEVKADFPDPLWLGLRPLLQQLCTWNKSHPDDAVRFFGVDIQDSWNHRSRLEEALGGKPDPDLRRCFGAWVDSAAELSAWGKAHGHPPPSPADHERCLGRLDLLVAKVEDPDLRQSVASLRGTQEANRAHLGLGDLPGGYAAREAVMHRVFLAERARLGGARTVLLAHDDHIARELPSYQPLGARLAGDHAYAAISVQAGVAESRLGVVKGPPAEGTREAAWAAQAEPRLFVDLRGDGGPHDAVLFMARSPRD